MTTKGRGGVPVAGPCQRSTRQPINMSPFDTPPDTDPVQGTAAARRKSTGLAGPAWGFHISIAERTPEGFARPARPMPGGT